MAEDDWHDEMEDRMDTIEARFDAAFPAGDVEGHRRYHEALIERNTEIRKLRMAIAEKTISALLWSALVWLFWHLLAIAHTAITKQGP